MARHGCPDVSADALDAVGGLEAEGVDGPVAQRGEAGRDTVSLDRVDEGGGRRVTREIVSGARPTGRDRPEEVDEVLDDAPGEPVDRVCEQVGRGAVVETELDGQATGV